MPDRNSPVVRPLARRARLRELKRDISYQTKVGKQQLEELVHKLDIEQNLPRQCMVSLPYLPGIDDGIHRSKEGTVQPSSSL